MNNKFELSVSEILKEAFTRCGISCVITSKLAEKINLSASMELCSEQQKVFSHNALADILCFLIEGTANLTRVENNKDQNLAKLKGSLIPLGISALNAPGRYSADLTIDAGSRYLRFSLKKWHDLIYSEPMFGAKLLAFVVARATELVWASRGLQRPISGENRNIAKGSIHKTGKSILPRIQEGAFFSSLGTENLRKLLKYCELVLYSKGQSIALENVNSDGLYILFSGRVETIFSCQSEGKLSRKSRTIVRPGVALSWSNGYSSMSAPYTVIATRDTRILRISQSSLAQLIDDDCALGSALLQRQIWQIGRYQESATGLAHFIGNDEGSLLDSLLKHNGSRIPVNSLLHGAAHALKSRFTRDHAFNCLYQSIVNGNDAERSVAGLALDSLKGVERENRFFKQLNNIYTRVVAAPWDINSRTLLKLSNADFARAFDQVPYVIMGQENLPSDPRSIFIYNHLAAHPKNQLANGQAFSIDSQFISAKILVPRYKDGGLRIVRASRKTEFWRSGYYSRLDNIVVHTLESDELSETLEEKHFRKNQFFIQAQRAFDNNRPIVIAPEGTSETPDNLTETSPGPFKSGAFLLSHYLTPDPLIIPIALANFDNPISQTVFAAVIKPAIRIRDYVSDLEDEKSLIKFLGEYRQNFRGYVEEARNLAESIQSRSLNEQKNMSTNVGLVSPVEEEFEADIREVEFKLSEQIKFQKKVVLYGSSTFRLWESASRDLSIPNLLNLGFGGATLKSCRVFFDRIVVPHNPEKIFFYVGDNDLGSGMSVDEVLYEFDLLMAQVSEKTPQAYCYVVSIKPSPFRADLESSILQTNSKIFELITKTSHWSYIDLHSAMLENSGRLSSVFFDDDPLHMNDLGYAVLSKLIRDTLATSI